MLESALFGILFNRPSVMKRPHCLPITPSADDSLVKLVRASIPTTVKPFSVISLGFKGDSPRMEEMADAAVRQSEKKAIAVGIDIHLMPRRLCTRFPGVVKMTRCQN